MEQGGKGKDACGGFRKKETLTRGGFLLFVQRPESSRNIHAVDGPAFRTTEMESIAEG